MCVCVCVCIFIELKLIEKHMYTRKNKLTKYRLPLFVGKLLYLILTLEVIHVPPNSLMVNLSS